MLECLQACERLAATQFEAGTSKYRVGIRLVQVARDGSCQRQLDQKDPHNFPLQIHIPFSFPFLFSRSSSLEPPLAR